VLTGWWLPLWQICRGGLVWFGARRAGGRAGVGAVSGAEHAKKLLASAPGSGQSHQWLPLWQVFRRVGLVWFGASHGVGAVSAADTA
jgi:hypothetical protein